ncbi:hypothetical protein [Streptosporangium sp. G12]
MIPRTTTRSRPGRPVVDRSCRALPDREGGGEFEPGLRRLLAASQGQGRLGGGGGKQITYYLTKSGTTVTGATT